MTKRLLLLLLVLIVGGGFWYRGLIKSVVTPAFVAAATEEATTSPTPIADPNTFHYDALGITAPISLLLGSDAFNPDDWQKFTDALNQGVSVSTTAQSVAEATTLYITGHSSTAKPNPYSFIFAGLGQAKEGHTFSFSTDNETYTYKIVGKQVIDPSDEQSFIKLEAQVGQPQRALLVTCWPVFTTKNRMVIVGERVSP